MTEETLLELASKPMRSMADVILALRREGMHRLADDLTRVREQWGRCAAAHAAKPEQPTTLARELPKVAL